MLSPRKTIRCAPARRLSSSAVFVPGAGRCVAVAFSPRELDAEAAAPGELGFGVEGAQPTKTAARKMLKAGTLRQITTKEGTWSCSLKQVELSLAYRGRVAGG